VLQTYILLGYGQTGPYRTAAGYDVIIEGEAGLMHMSVERAF
jgi:succinate---hydroxymethylglutarate CoA-transferase